MASISCGGRWFYVPRHWILTRKICSTTGVSGMCCGPSEELEQRTQEWLDVRKDRLTASAFANALGFFKGKRDALWQEKIGIGKEFLGNAATEWGVANEPRAVERYRSITGHTLQHIGFKIYKEEDEQNSWLGASPDGLIAGNESEDFEKPGILEVKCPHNQGKQNGGVPWSRVPYYYVPQAQGLLEILNRDWMDFYVWTKTGSATFRITRDPEYWNLIHGVLREFWWENVLPAREAVEAGKTGKFLRKFKPKVAYPLRKAVIERSRVLCTTYPLIWRDLDISLQRLKASSVKLTTDCSETAAISAVIVTDNAAPNVSEIAATESGVIAAAESPVVASIDSTPATDASTSAAEITESQATVPDDSVNSIETALIQTADESRKCSQLTEKGEFGGFDP